MNEEFKLNRPAKPKGVEPTPIERSYRALRRYADEWDEPSKEAAKELADIAEGVRAAAIYDASHRQRENTLSEELRYITQRLHNQMGFTEQAQQETRIATARGDRMKGWAIFFAVLWALAVIWALSSDAWVWQ